MTEYKLEVKQIVDYPRCRMYRQLIQKLMRNKDIRTGGTSGLFYYTVLSGYANFRTSYNRIKGVSYTIHPGEWVCAVTELAANFRTKTRKQTVAVLDMLQQKHLITYSVLGHGDIIKYSIIKWKTYNHILDYNAPCQKDIGFFFMPMQIAGELVRSGRCSEMDALLDLWLNTVYNDPRVQGSEVSPVVYLRNGSGSPLVSYAELAGRWGVSKATAGRYIQHLNAIDCISCVSFSGKRGSIISLKGYLSTMFQVSDVLLDKEEIALALAIRVVLPEEAVCVSESHSYVAATDGGKITEKILFFLNAQGFLCADCSRLVYKLYRLSDCRRNTKDIVIGEKYLLLISCGGRCTLFRFALRLTPQDSYGGG